MNSVLPLRVLVVEDNLMNLMQLWGRLRQTGVNAEFTFVESVNEADKALNKKPFEATWFNDQLEQQRYKKAASLFDLVLMDNQLPDQVDGDAYDDAGKALVGRIRAWENAHQVHVPFYVIGHSSTPLDPHETVEGRELFDGVIRKPASVSEYTALFKKALGIAPINRLENTDSLSENLARI